MPTTTGADEAAGTTAEALPSQARRGYGLGSVVTGSFGAVPGLLLLPFLTDRLAVPAVVASVIVFLWPRAQGHGPVTACAPDPPT